MNGRIGRWDDRQHAEDSTSREPSGRREGGDSVGGAEARPRRGDSVRRWAMGRPRLPEWNRLRIWAIEGFCLLVALGLTGLVLADFRSPPDLLLFIGRFHPMIVHFPIGLLLLAALLEAFSMLRPFRAVRHATAFVLFLGAVSAVGAVVVGYLLSLQGGYDEELLSRHKWLGFTVAVGAMAAAYLKIRGWGRGSKLLHRTYQGVLLATVGVLMAAGHLGGSLTHGSGYLTYYLPQPVKELLRVEGGSRSAIVHIDSAFVYQDLVAPVLERRCVSCHGPSRVDGGLRLDSPDALRAGGDGPPAITAGNPEGSELLRRITLPPDHPDAMPPGRAMPVGIGETELIRWWIANGASVEHRVADIAEIPSSVATLFNRIAPPRPETKVGLYALEASPADPRALAALRADGFAVTRISEDLPFLQITPLEPRGAFTGEKLARLLDVAEQVAWLNLSRTQLEEETLVVLAQLPNLTRLRLDGTGIGDGGLVYLRDLRKLEYLNLHDTRVSDQGLEQLAGLDALRSLYLWMTDVTPEGASGLQDRLPELDVMLGAGIASAGR
jgi:uncharacterized membrane protein